MDGNNISSTWGILALLEAFSRDHSITQVNAISMRKRATSLKRKRTESDSDTSSESNRTTQGANPYRRAKTPGNAKTEESTSDSNEARELQPELEPFKILTAGIRCGRLLFHVQWKNTDRMELVPAPKMYRKYPQSVIQFYQSRLVFPK